MIYVMFSLVWMVGYYDEIKLFSTTKGQTLPVFQVTFISVNIISKSLLNFWNISVTAIFFNFTKQNKWLGQLLCFVIFFKYVCL